MAKPLHVKLYNLPNVFLKINCQSRSIRQDAIVPFALFGEYIRASLND